MADQPEENNKIDIDKILLPKKEGVSLDSAQRVQAGALLAQEQKAELPKVEKPAPSTPPPPKNEDEVKPLQTFQGDIEKVVQTKNVSLVSVAAAESNRRSQQPLKDNPEGQQNTGAWKKISMIVLGATLIVSSLGLLGYFLIKIPPPAATPEAQTPFVTVDMTQDLVLEPLDNNRNGLMEGLVAARDTLQISLGLVARLRVGVASTTGDAHEFTTAEFLTTLAPNAPEELKRTLDPTFILGIYAYAGKQPFLLLKTDSYERAFAAMLAWEKTMRTDLLPFFDHTPPVHGPTQSIDTTSSSTLPTIPIPTTFVDRVIENHDTRVIQNEYHDLLFLWTFLDRKTILITSTDDVVKEVIRRIKDAPIVQI